jgi:hypothetical protein
VNISEVGHKNFERWPPIAWRRSAETVGQMRGAHWQVFAYCRTCHLTVTVDLRVIELARGADFSLWNRQAKCRRLGCGGPVEFQGQPPETHFPFALRAEWPFP